VNKERQWGILPDEAVANLKKREWDNTSRLKKRLKNILGNPIEISLKPPKGKEIFGNIEKFQELVSQWKNYKHTKNVSWGTVSFKDVGQQLIPLKLVINDFLQLKEVIGRDAIDRISKWEETFDEILSNNDEGLLNTLINNIDRIEKLPKNEVRMLGIVINELKKNRWTGIHSRSIPIAGMDTKFLENNEQLITRIMDEKYDSDVSGSGGLFNWLGCKENDSGWLYIRSLCKEVSEKMAGLPTIKMSSADLINYSLPAKNILIIENVQPGLSLPEIKDTIAVFGGGKNTVWTKASWLKSKNVFYWGDLDSWGFSFLNDVRLNMPDTTSVMMDVNSLEQHKDQIVTEGTICAQEMPLLTAQEQKAITALKNAVFGGDRLEQEKLSQKHVKNELKKAGLTIL